MESIANSQLLTEAVRNTPQFSVPANLTGEIFMGDILDLKHLGANRLCQTIYDYRIDESMLTHAVFTGIANSGKTVAAMRFVAEASKIRRRRTGKRLRVIVLDTQNVWRTFARFVESERFRCWSVGKRDVDHIKLNVWKIPRGMQPKAWINCVIDIYCRAYGLLERGKKILENAVYRIYEREGVLDIQPNQPGWEEKVSEASAKVCFADVYWELKKDRERLLAQTADLATGEDGRRASYGQAMMELEAHDRLLLYLSCFGWASSVECELHGTTNGISVDELLSDDDVTVLESRGLECTFANFLFGVVAAGVYKYAESRDGGFLADGQYETAIVIEDANEVLIGADTAREMLLRDATGQGCESAPIPGQSVFDEMNEMMSRSAELGLYVVAITQKIADLPSAVVSNCGLLFAGRLMRPADISVVAKLIGQEMCMDGQGVKWWFPHFPIGWFVAQALHTGNGHRPEPVLVQIRRLDE